MPDDIINASVMNAMIERSRQGALIGMSSHDRQVLRELEHHPMDTIDKLIARAHDNPDQSNATRLRMEAALVLLKQEKDRRPAAKAQSIEREAPGRSR